MGHDFVSFFESHSANAHRVAAGEHPQLGHGKPDRLALAAGQQQVVVQLADFRVHETNSLFDPHCDLPVRPHVCEVGEFIASNTTGRSYEYDLDAVPPFFGKGDRYHRADGHAGFRWGEG